MKPQYSKERMLVRFNKNVFPEPNTGCWLWSGAITPNGYPNFSWRPGKIYLGHRFSYLIYKGEFDRSLLVCHTCDTPSCVNPEHLFLGTVTDNNADRDRKGRFNVLNGSRNGMAKLNEEKVREIKALIKLGVSFRKIGKMYGIDPSIPHRIKDGKVWKHVDGRSIQP